MSPGPDPGAGRPDVAVWFRVLGLLVPAVATAGLAALAATASGLLAVLGWAMTAAVALVLLAALATLAVPRRRRDLPPPPGTVVVDSPWLLTVGLVGAWLTAVVVAVVTVAVAVVDLGAMESPGAAWVVVVGVIGSTPDLVRLLTGRLHRWRLVLSPEGVTYRGYRTDETIPWSKVHGARIQRRGPAGVVIDRKGTGADPVVPAAAFTVPAAQLVEEIERHLASYRR